MLRRRLVRSGRHEQPRRADPVGLEFLDDDAIEKRAKVVAHFCALTLRMRPPHAHTPVLVQIGAGVVGLLVTVAFVALMLTAAQQRSDARALARATETVTQIERVQRLALDLESSVRGYVITGQGGFSGSPYFAARERYPRSRHGGSSAWSTTARRRLLRDGQDYARSYADRVIAAQRRSGKAAIAPGEGKRRMDALRSDLALLRGVEQPRAGESGPPASATPTGDRVRRVRARCVARPAGALLIFLRRRIASDRGARSPSGRAGPRTTSCRG